MRIDLTSGDPPTTITLGNDRQIVDGTAGYGFIRGWKPQRTHTVLTVKPIGAKTAQHYSLGHESLSFPVTISYQFATMDAACCFIRDTLKDLPSEADLLLTFPDGGIMTLTRAQIDPAVELHRGVQVVMNYTVSGAKIDDNVNPIV